MSSGYRYASFVTRATSLTALAGICAVPVFAQTPAAPAAAPAPAAAAAPAAPAPPVTVNAQLEVNYTGNFNKPFNGSNTYLYNQKEGQFAINLAEVKVSKATTTDSRTGFTIRVIDGEVRKEVFNPGEGSLTDPKALPNILEAYGTFLAPIGGKDVKVDVGQFVTHVGYETIDVQTNNFFSRSFLFQYPAPVYNAGVRAAVPITAKTTISGFLLNRFNGTNDTGNRDIAPGFQIVQTISPVSSLTLNGLYSRENMAYDGTQQPGDTSLPSSLDTKPVGILDLIYTGQIGPTLKLAAEGLYRFGKVTTLTTVGESTVTGDTSYSSTGGALYLILPMKGGNTAALRGEILGQSKEGSIILPDADSTKKPSLSSITASYELHWAAFPNLRTLLEYRLDTANTDIFPGSNATDYKKNQSTLTIGQIFSF
jgi:hypothetical protein